MKEINRELIEDLMTDGESLILDVIRIIAASVVLIGHGKDFFEINSNYKMPIQNIGVVIFFVLAGYLMSYSLLKNRNQDFRSYMKRKAIRIYSILIPCLIFVATLDYIMINAFEHVYEYVKSYNTITFIGNILMLQDMPFFGRYITSFGTARPLWTLSLEWWLYIFAAVVYYNVYQKEIIKNSDLFLTISLGVVMVTYMVAGRGNGLGTCFVCGMGIYYLVHKHIRNEFNVVYIMSATVFLGGVFVVGINQAAAYTYYNFCFVSLGLLFAVLGFKNKVIDVRLKKIISFIARSTFALYLTHYSIMYWVVRVYGSQSCNSKLLFVTIVISWIVACVITFIFENVRKKYIGNSGKRQVG